MRTFVNILIIIFVVVSLYTLRGDLKTIYVKSISLLEPSKPLVVATTNVNYELNPAPKSKLDTLKDILNEPKPLRVVDSFITGDINNLSLSRAGVIKYTNANRTDAGLAPLAENKNLDLSAEKKLKDMFTNQYFEHVSPVNKKSVSDLGSEAGYDYILIGENLAEGNFKDDAALVQAWMDSPGHRANIMNKNYVDIGVAAGSGEYQGRKVWMAVQHFGLPRTACPDIEKVLGASISLDRNKITKMNQDLAQRKIDISNGGLVGGKTTNEQIAEYNTIVNDFNSLIIKLRNEVEKYNSEVNKFNDCLNSKNKE